MAHGGSVAVGLNLTSDCLHPPTSGEVMILSIKVNSFASLTENVRKKSPCIRVQLFQITIMRPCWILTSVKVNWDKREF